jgi:GT2 family glycosyltransferase
VSPDISVIVLNWNGRTYLEPCLEALFAQEGADYEVIVVDNASTDGTPDLVRARFPDARLVVLPANRGFAAGNNAGGREARAPFVAFLNNDTIPDRAWLRNLRAGVRPDAGFTLATSRIVYMHDPSVVDSAGDGLLRWGGAYKRHHGAPVETAPASGEVFGVCGAACMLPTAVFEELGGFDEAFFASHEDVDLSYRARLLGHRCWYVSDAIVRHHGSATLGRVSASSVFLGQRNVEWMYVKNTPGSLLWRTLPGHIIYDLAAGAHFARQGLFGTYVKAKVAAVGGLPRVLRQRWTLQRRRSVTASMIDAVLDKRWLAVKRAEKRFDTRLAAGMR